jgi:hypothetical protein
MLKILFAAALATGCNQFLRPGDLPALTAQTSGDRVRTWQRSIDVLLDEGYVPDVLNEAAGYISAKQRDDVQIGKLSGTSVIVTVSPEGRLRVEVSGHGTYASSSGLVDDLNAVQKDLLAKIMAAAQAPAPQPAAPPPPAAPAAPTT